MIAKISGKTKIGHALKESENRYRLLVENINEAIALLDEHGIFTYVNNRFLETVDYDRKEVLGRPVAEFVEPPSLDLFREEMLLRKERRREFYELVWGKKDNEKMTILIWPSPIYDERKNFKGVVLVIKDIAEGRRVEEEFNKSRQELRNLSRHLQSIRENEAKRIAREIHDELGQALTAIKMDISWMSQRLSESHKDKDKERFLGKINSMSKIIDMTIQTIQKISAELRPGLLDDLGLVAAIEWLGQDFQKRTGVKCRLNLNCEDSALGPDCSTAIFRVVQEALTNVARHAKASHVSICLKENEEELELEIKDNGKGIREEEIYTPESFGLIGMRERLNPFGGILKLRGIPERGTTLSILVPLKKAREK